MGINLACIGVNSLLCDLLGVDDSSYRIHESDISRLAQYVEKDLGLDDTFVYSFIGKTIWELAQEIVHQSN